MMCVVCVCVTKELNVELVITSFLDDEVVIQGPTFTSLLPWVDGDATIGKHR